MTNEPQDFDIGKIRELLLAAFDVDELERFCKDRPAFSPICLRFSPAMGLDDRVDEVLDYCRTQLLLPELLQQVAEANWRQYAQFQPDLGSSAPPIPPEPALETRPTAPPTPAPSTPAWLGGRRVYWIGGLVGGVLLLLIAGWAIARVLNPPPRTPVPTTSVPTPVLTEPIPTEPAPKYSFQILFDRSEAMKALFEGETKLQMAQKEIRKVLSNRVVDADDNLALRLFGGPCTGLDKETSEIVVEFGRNNRQAVEAKLQITETQGIANLASAIKLAANDFVPLKLPEDSVKRIIVITGSDKFCTEDCEELKQDIKDNLARSPGITLETRVIGLALSTAQQNCFKEIAELPEVSFLSAKNSAELGVAVAAAFAEPTGTPVTPPPPTDTPVPPAAPSGIAASDGTDTDKVRVTWGSVVDATYYEVYRATSPEGPKDLLDRTTAASYDDATAAVGTTYTYWVVACNSWGCSDFSASDTGSRSGTPPAAPAGIAASDGASTDKVRVTWNAVGDATRYEVYRAPSPEGPKDDPLDRTTAASYDDADAAVRTNYTYWVKACNRWGCSDFSVHDTGFRTPYPAPTLLEPDEGATLTGNYLFRWQGMPLPDNLAYDLRIWRKGEPPSKARGVDEPTTKTERSVNLQFAPAILEHGETDYYWTVLVVEVVETETGDLQVVNDVGQWAEQRKFTYKD